MPVTHTNRAGVVYYLHQGQTPKGKPRYFFSKKGEGTLAGAVPAGYEISEKPTGQVFLRKTLVSAILPEETALVEAGVRRTGEDIFFIEVTKDAIEVHLPNIDRSDLERLRKELGAMNLPARVADRMRAASSFSPAMRFHLIDRERDTFAVQRWVSRGEERWSWTLASGPLEALVAKYTPHLGKESFFDLM
jgi:hypothetical protein